MHNLRSLILASFFLIATKPAFSQSVNADSVAQKGFMVSNDKIYVVGAIVLTILAGLFVYVARLDKKISKLEKEG